MVAFLHSAKDNEAGFDLARIYNTRTMETVYSVTPMNAANVLSRIMDKRYSVVIPDDDKRIAEALRNVVRCCRIMNITVWQVELYLDHMKSQEKPAPATASAHAKPVATGAG